MTERKYWATYAGVSLQVFPRNSDKLKLVDTREPDQKFFRRRLSGKPMFVNNKSDDLSDFDIFGNLEKSGDSCVEVKLTISEKCGDTWTTIWRGYFTTSKGKFDLDECTFEVEVLPDDEYRCILENWENIVNMFDIPDPVSTSAFFSQDNFEYWFCRSASGTCPATGCDDDIPDPQESWKFLYKNQDFDPNGDWICIYYREVATTNCVGGIPQPPSGSGWILLTDDCLGSSTAVWVRQPISDPDYPALHIQAGICDTGTALPPPPRVEMNVVLSSGNSGNQFDVIGKSLVCGGTSQKWSIIAPTSSTFLWDCSNGSIIASSSGTTTTTATFVFNSVGFGGVLAQIFCVETTICGDHIVHKIDIVVQDLATFPIANEFYIVGPKQICTSQTGIVFTVPEEVRYLISNSAYPRWTVGPGLTIVSGQGTWTLTCDATGIEQNNVQLLSVQVAANTGCFSAFLSQQLIGTISKHPLTEAIEGQDILCPSSTGAVYRVQPRVGSTYAWDVDGGGTIVSGAGTNEIVVDWGATPGSYLVTCKETMECGCDWTLIADCGAENETPYWWCTGQLGSSILLDRNRYLMDVIEYALTQLGCDNAPTLISDFFERNPVGTAPDYVAGNNYVTLDTNRVNYLTLTQKSDIKSYDSSDPATIGNVSFKLLMDWMREVFQVYWFMQWDATLGKYRLRLEHKKFFTFATGLNLMQDRYKEMLRAQNKYDHLNDTLPKYERYQMMEALGRDFVGAEIRYESLCVNQSAGDNVLNHEVMDVTTDLNFILTDPEDISEDGFVILANEFDGTNLTVMYEQGELTGLPVLNGHMAWANLHVHYHKYERMLKEGFMNEVLTQFVSAIPNIRQVPLEITLCCDDYFDPKEKIITELGFKRLGGLFAYVESAELNLHTDVLKLILVYQFSELRPALVPPTNLELRTDAGRELRSDGDFELRS